MDKEDFPENYLHLQHKVAGRFYEELGLVINKITRDDEAFVKKYAYAFIMGLLSAICISTISACASDKDAKLVAIQDLIDNLKNEELLNPCKKN